MSGNAFTMLMIVSDILSKQLNTYLLTWVSNYRFSKYKYT